MLVEDDETASNFFEGGVDVSKYLPVDASILAIMDDDNEVGYGASLGKTWDNGFQVAYTYHSIDEAEHSFGLSVTSWKCHSLKSSLNRSV